MIAPIYILVSGGKIAIGSNVYPNGNGKVIGRRPRGYRGQRVGIAVIPAKKNMPVEVACV